MVLFRPFKQETVSFFAFIRDSYFCPPQEPLSTELRFLYAWSGSLLAGVTIILAFSLVADLTEYASRDARSLQEAGVLQEGQVERAKEVLRQEKGLLEAKQLQERSARLKARIRSVARARAELARAWQEAKAQSGRARADMEFARVDMELSRARKETEALLNMARTGAETNELGGFGIMPYLIGFTGALSLYFAWLVSYIPAKQGPLYLFVKGLVFTGFVLFIVQTIIERMRVAL